MFAQPMRIVKWINRHSASSACMSRLEADDLQSMSLGCRRLSTEITPMGSAREVEDRTVRTVSDRGKTPWAYVHSRRSWTRPITAAHTKEHLSFADGCTFKNFIASRWRGMCRSQRTENTLVYICPLELSITHRIVWERVHSVRTMNECQ